MRKVVCVDGQRPNLPNRWSTDEVSVIYILFYTSLILSPPLFHPFPILNTKFLQTGCQYREYSFSKGLFYLFFCSFLISLYCCSPFSFTHFHSLQCRTLPPICSSLTCTVFRYLISLNIYLQYWTWNPRRGGATGGWMGRKWSSQPSGELILFFIRASRCDTRIQFRFFGHQVGFHIFCTSSFLSWGMTLNCIRQSYICCHHYVDH